MWQLKLKEEKDEENKRLLEEENKKLKAINQQLKLQLESMKSIFTKGQIRKLKCSNQIQIKWTVDDIASAMSLYEAGPRCKLLRKRGYPLPGVSTLRRWVGKINIQPGILNTVLTLMKNASLSKMEKACIILADEMKIQRAYEYDKKADSTLNQSNYVQDGSWYM